MPRSSKNSARMTNPPPSPPESGSACGILMTSPSTCCNRNVLDSSSTSRPSSANENETADETPKVPVKLDKSILSSAISSEMPTFLHNTGVRGPLVHRDVQPNAQAWQTFTSCRGVESESSSSARLPLSVSALFYTPFL